MGKGGRPRKSIKESRSIEVKFYLNEEEYALLYEKAKSSKRTVSGFCREKCLEKNHFTYGADVKVFISEMGKIGVNLNQFVKKVNSLKENNGQQAINFLERSNFKEVNQTIEIIKNAQMLWWSLNDNMI